MNNQYDNFNKYIYNKKNLNLQNIERPKFNEQEKIIQIFYCDVNLDSNYHKDIYKYIYNQIEFVNIMESKYECIILNNGYNLDDWFVNYNYWIDFINNRDNMEIAIEI